MRHPPRQIFLVGIGMGNPDTLTLEARKAIESAQLLVGAARMTEPFLSLGKAIFCSFSPQETLDYLQKHQEFTRIAVLFSGDVGFYSGAAPFLKALEQLPNRTVSSICGISAPVYFCAKLQIPWENLPLLSLHGRETSWLNVVAAQPRTFLLTGGAQRVSALCRQLCAQGLGQVTVFVGERLSYPEERIVAARAEELVDTEFDSLSVMLIQNPSPRALPVTHGLPDESFSRGSVPMTKSEVRSVCLSKLRLSDGETVYDIGAGTGSVSVEIALQIPRGLVYAIEKNPAALSLVNTNRERFFLQNLHLIAGKAPAALTELPAPDCAFLGGTGGELHAILSALIEKNPAVRVVLSAITLETLQEALTSLRALDFPDPEIVQIAVSKAERMGGYHLMKAQNPVFLLSASRKEASP